MDHLSTRKFNVLLKRISSDRKAYVALYEYYYPRLVVDMTVKFGDKYFAEDVVQRFFTERIFRIDPPKRVEYPASWLSTICYRMALDEKRRRKPDVEFDDLAATASRESSSAGFDEDLMQERFDLPDKDYYALLVDAGVSEELTEKLRALDRQSTEIILLRYFEGYSVKEIAQKLGLNYNTALSKFHRAITALRSVNSVFLALLGII